jgi:hypothetical protein
LPGLTHGCPARISLVRAHGIDSTQGPTFGDVTGHEENNAVPHENSVLHSVLQLAAWDTFEPACEQHGATARARGFSCQSHLVALLSGQLAGASSLREIEAGMHSHAARLYHLGARPAHRASLADANRHRPVAPFGALLAAMIGRAHRGLRRAMDGVTYLIDSTSIMLNARSAWARFSAMAIGVKTHVI